jgi:uncharacterized membrane protein
MGPMGPHNNGGTLDTISILLGVIIVLLFVVILYQWYNQNKEQKYIHKDIKTQFEPKQMEIDKIEVALKLLNENEKLIVQALIEKGGEILQKDISSEMGLSRVQTHRSVQSLINRDIVTVENYFNTNKISLSEWLKE